MPVMEVGPPGSPCRRGTQTSGSCDGQEPSWSAFREKARRDWVRWATRRRTCVNHCRRIEKNKDGIKTEGCTWPSGQRHAFGSALSQGAACSWPWRCPVYRWRELVAGAGMEVENLSSHTDDQINGRGRPPGRKREEPKRRTPQWAEYRCEAQGRDGPQ